MSRPTQPGHCTSLPAGLIAAVCRALRQTRVHILIRPRPGYFLYSRDELSVMRQDVLHAATCGAHGVALGMLTADGAVDQDQLRPFADLCLALGMRTGGCCGACGVGGLACNIKPNTALSVCRQIRGAPGCLPAYFAGLDLTFHRAFDLIKDQRKALDDLVACRVRRVLSSGGWSRPAHPASCT